MFRFTTSMWPFGDNLFHILCPSFFLSAYMTNHTRPLCCAVLCWHLNKQTLHRHKVFISLQAFTWDQSRGEFKNASQLILYFLSSDKNPHLWGFDLWAGELRAKFPFRSILNQPRRLSDSDRQVTVGLRPQLVFSWSATETTRQMSVVSLASFSIRWS